MTAADPTGATPHLPMMERPGFLIRRLHQIHVALFARHCAQFGITPVQYSLLSALAVRGEADQTSLAADILFDRTTTTGALLRLQNRGLIERVISRQDKRARACRLTVLGAETLAGMEGAARTAHHETIAALDASDRASLLHLMKQLVLAHGEDATGAE